MADHSVIARDEQRESEGSQSLMSCFESASPENSCFVIAMFCSISLCLQVPFFLNATRRENSGSMQFVKTEERSSRSLRELKFVCYISGEKISEKSFK